MKKLFLVTIFILVFLPLIVFARYFKRSKISELTNYYDGNWIVAGLIKNSSDNIYSYVSLSLIKVGENGN